MIQRVIIHNFKGIKEGDVTFNSYKNVIVGNNGVGKSTLMEAVSLAMGYGLNKLEVTPHLFHVDCVKHFVETKELPEITIEVMLSGEKDEYSGTNNTLHQNLRGLQLKICFDEAYEELFEAEKETCTQIPCEYYKIQRFWFSDVAVKQQLMPCNVLLVDSSSTYFNASSNQYIASLLKKYMGNDDLVKMQSSLRHLREYFEGDSNIGEINRKLGLSMENLKVSIDVTSNIVLRNILCPYWEDIPISQIGEGDLCILKTLLSIDKLHLNDKDKIVIIEEPETHLSHSKMYELIRKIEENVQEGRTQLIITTHNSFVANKLDLSNLLLLDNDKGIMKVKKIDSQEKELYRFFTKISNYPTLRLVLCKSALLVEGPTDEMVVTYYYKKKYNKHPFDDGIELISVEGIKFKQFVELAKSFGKKIAVITDNDGMLYDQVLNQRGLRDLPDNIRMFTEQDITLKTIEPSFVARNESMLQELASVVREKKICVETKETLTEFMINNKTEWAYRLLMKADFANFEVPQYILNAIDWLLGVDDEK